MGAFQKLQVAHQALVAKYEGAKTTRDEAIAQLAVVSKAKDDSENSMWKFVEIITQKKYDSLAEVATVVVGTCNQGILSM